MSRITLLLLLLFTHPVISAEKPDILMIAVDDLRPMLGCYGDQNIKTPHIDALAARGMLFENAYCQYAKCGTSRLSIMTGLRPDSIGVFSNNFRDVSAFRRKRPDLKSLGHWFKDNGYYTRSFGKIYHDEWDNPNDWSEPSSPGRPREMWEVVDETNPTGPTIIAERLKCPVMQSPDVPDSHLYAGRMTDEVVALIKNRKSEQPRFIAAGYRRPHLPFIAPQKYYDLYKPDETWLPVNPSPPKGVFPIAWFNSDGYGKTAQNVGLEMPNPPTRREAIAWNGYEMRSYLGVPYHGVIPTELQLDLIHAYAACISYVDTQIGRLLSALESSGQRNNTIVILWSDHGWHLGESSAWGKMTNYDIATRVPLIISDPSTKPGKANSFAELVDIYPTLCQLAGIPAPDHLEGGDLSAVVRNEEAPGKLSARSQYSRYKDKFVGHTVKTHQFRYVKWTDKSGKTVAEEYYDSVKDPHETHNGISELSEMELEKVRSALQ
ncbi:MAG: sulfatase [Verrucomicrobiales bacterium]|nr:sulfatase [Verrucomicrobiales bacterium]